MKPPMSVRTQCKIDNFGVMDLATIPSDYFDPQRLNDLQLQEVRTNTASADGTNAIAIGDNTTAAGTNSCAVGPICYVNTGAVVGTNVQFTGSSGARYCVGPNSVLSATSKSMTIGNYNRIASTIGESLAVGNDNYASSAATSGLNVLVGASNTAGLNGAQGRSVLIGRANLTESLRNVFIGWANGVIGTGTQRASVIGSSNTVQSVSSASHAVIGNSNFVARNENTQIIGNNIVLDATSSGDRCIVGNNLNTSVYSLEDRSFVAGVDNTHFVSVAGGISTRSVAIMRPLFKVTKTTYTDLVDFALTSLVNNELIVKTSHVSPVIMTMPPASVFSLAYTSAFGTGGLVNSVFSFMVVNRGSANLTLSHSSVVGAGLVVAANTAARFRVSFASTTYTLYRLS